MLFFTQLKIKPNLFHPDIDRFLYYADSPLKNYEYNDICKTLNIQIVVGNSRSGHNIICNEEPSALYTEYKIIKPLSHKLVGKVPHYPRYRALNPYQRYEYIQFLINPYQETEIGYVYLLLYCLERRLSEGQEEVIPVMQKLADFHGGKFSKSVNETLRKYQLWKSGSRFPQNVKVYNNYTIYCSCYDSTHQ